MKKLSLLSASQISLFRQCPRLWVERYLFGHKLPSTKEMDEGLEVHQAIETLLKRGQLVEGRWQKVLESLAARLREMELIEGTSPAKGVLSEKPIRLRLVDDVWFSGAIDILDDRYPDKPEILDLKSKKSFDYLLSEWELASDPQLAIYAYSIMKPRGLQEIVIKHVYALRNEDSPDVRVVPATVSFAQVEGVLAGIVEDAEKMLELSRRELASSTEIPGNENSCFAFGKPCHYLNQCDPQSELVGLRKKPEETMDNAFLEELRAKKKAKAESAGSGAVVAAPLPEASLLPPGAPSRDTVPVASAVLKPAPKKTKAAETASEAPASVAAPPTVPTPSSGFRTRVYVRCRPNRAVTALADWIRPIEDAVAAGLGVPHWKAVQFISHGEAAMIVALREALPKLPEEVSVTGDEAAAGLFLTVVEGADVIRAEAS